MKKKILIFGGTGAIGFSIAKNLKSQGYNPIIIARNEEDLINKSKEIDCLYEIIHFLRGGVCFPVKIVFYYKYS